MGKTKVVNVKFEKYDVYIGRLVHLGGDYYGNPFKVGEDGTRAEVLEKFRAYFHARLRTDPTYRAKVSELRGKTLGCHCKGPPEGRAQGYIEPVCHGDVYVAWLES